MKKNGNTFSPETVISFILRWGVVVSAAIILFGVVLMLAKQDTLGSAWNLDNLLSYNPTTPPSFFPLLDLGSILSQAVRLQPFAIIDLGLLLLIAIPALRVATSIILFAIIKDRLYVVITSIVLAVLLVSFLLIR
jgi:uncharacterized membrane protein